MDSLKTLGQFHLYRLLVYRPLCNGNILKQYFIWNMYVGKSIRELQIQVAIHVLELSTGNCHR